MEELLKLFEENPGLGHKVEVMWAHGASAQEISEMLDKNGVKAEPADIEELLALLQKRRAEAIGDGEKVDRGQLKAVAGGWCAFWQSKQGWGDTCEWNFQYVDDYSGRKICFADTYCDTESLSLGNRYFFDEK